MISRLSGFFIPFCFQIFLGRETIAAAQTSLQDYSIVEREQDFAVHRRVFTATNESGIVTAQTNQFTVLDPGMHYLDGGEWKESRDLVEPFPQGAIARYGAYQTIFSPDLHSEAVFDISTPDGKRIRGGVRAIQLTDFANGKSVVLATVKPSAPGQIVEPNMVLYPLAFDGLRADVLYIWKHNAWSQNVLINERLGDIPDGLDPATTRLEVVTEMVECPEPKISEQTLKQDNAPDFADHFMVGFGQMIAVPGTAFPVGDPNALNLTGASQPAETAVHVAKQFRTLDDGRKFIIESVPWMEIEPHLKNLPLHAEISGKSRAVAQSRLWPKAIKSSPETKPMQVAALDYQPQGYLVDLEILTGSASSKTFQANYTYYLPSGYMVTSSATFGDGVVIKLAPGQSLTVSGTITCPVSGIATITSRDDDTIGQQIVNAGSPPYTSDGVVSDADWAYIGLQLYNVSYYGATVERFRIRYCSRGTVHYSPYYTHVVKNCRFEHCTYGIFIYDTLLSLINNEKCDMRTAFWTVFHGSNPGESGTLEDCGTIFNLKSFLGVHYGEVVDGQMVPGTPDSMGSIGPNHFIELVNGAIVIFSRSNGQRLAQTGINAFFSLTDNGITYPRSDMVDPCIIYDHRSSRWFASAMESLNAANNQVILAVSKTSDPVGNPPYTDWRNLKWDRYFVDVVESGGSIQDFPRLGTDDNGVYMTVDHAGTPRASIIAIQKSALLATPPNLNGISTRFGGIYGATIQPGVNFDVVSLTGSAWFIRNTNTHNTLEYATVTWTAGAPTLSSWTSLPITLYAPATVHIPSKGSSYQLIGHDKLSKVAIRNSQLWTAHQISVNANGGASNPDRAAVEWLRLTLNGTSASLADSGRVYDSSPTNPRGYGYPSIMVNLRGDAVLCFAGASNNEYIGAFSTCRLFSDAPGFMSIVNAIHFGEAPIDAEKWGDYTHTTLDPNNLLAMWTIQQFAGFQAQDWQTYVAEMIPVKP